MADLMVASSTYATGTLDTASQIVNNVTATNASQMNGVASACLAIEQILGNALTLKGSLADLATRLGVSLNADGTFANANSLWQTGDICASFLSSKTGWLRMDGTEYSCTTYINLFSTIVASFLVAITIGGAAIMRGGTSPGNPTVNISTGVFTLNNHGLGNGAVVYFYSSNLTYPGGMGGGGLAGPYYYYIVNSTTNTFQIALTQNGTPMTFNPTAYGTLTVFNTFILDTRGLVLMGASNMGGTARGNVTDSASAILGGGGGSATSVASHTHGVTDSGHAHNVQQTSASGTVGAGATPGGPAYDYNFFTTTNTSNISVNSAGSSQGNLQPYGTVNYFIKY